MTRLPFGDLERLAAGASTAELARTLDVDRRQLYRWRQVGVGWDQADELAGRLGLHPLEVWGRAWEAAAPAVRGQGRPLSGSIYYSPERSSWVLRVSTGPQPGGGYGRRCVIFRGGPGDEAEARDRLDELVADELARRDGAGLLVAS